MKQFCFYTLFSPSALVDHRKVSLTSTPKVSTNHSLPPSPAGSYTSSQQIKSLQTRNLSKQGISPGAPTISPRQGKPNYSHNNIYFSGIWNLYPAIGSVQQYTFYCKASQQETRSNEVKS